MKGANDVRIDVVGNQSENFVSDAATLAFDWSLYRSIAFCPVLFAPLNASGNVYDAVWATTNVTTIVDDAVDRFVAAAFVTRIANHANTFAFSFYLAIETAHYY